MHEQLFGYAYNKIYRELVVVHLLKRTRVLFSNPRLASFCKMSPILASISSVASPYRPLYDYIAIRKSVWWRGKKRKNQVPPRFELGLLDSESKVLAITPWDR